MSPHAAPALVVRAGGSDRTLTPGRSYKIGRDPHGDVVVADPRVSWAHAVLRVDDGQWVLEDSDSTNGTFAGSERIRKFAITGSCQVWLGAVGDGPVVLFSVAQPAAPVPADATNLRSPRRPRPRRAGFPVSAARARRGRRARSCGFRPRRCG